MRAWRFLHKQKKSPEDRVTPLPGPRNKSNSRSSQDMKYLSSSWNEYHSDHSLYQNWKGVAEWPSDPQMGEKLKQMSLYSLSPCQARLPEVQLLEIQGLNTSYMVTARSRYQTGEDGLHLAPTPGTRKQPMLQNGMGKDPMLLDISKKTSTRNSARHRAATQEGEVGSSFTTKVLLLHQDVTSVISQE
jgi:hypothetical protein